MTLLLVALAVVAAGLLGWWLGRRGRVPMGEAASGHVDGRPDVAIDPEQFKVIRIEKDGRELLQYRGGRSAVARQQYFASQQVEAAVGGQFWERPTPHSDYVLRSEWERD